MSAQELGEMKEQGTGAYEQVFQKANFREYMFKVRAKVDTFNVSEFVCVCACVCVYMFECVCAYVHV